MPTYILPKKLQKKLRAQVRERCVERLCRPDHRHDFCADCGGYTDSREMRVEEGSLRRRRVFVCSQCTWHTRPEVRVRQEELRRLRTETDWANISDPIAHAAIIPDRMHEQYAGKAREVIRAFSASAFSVATVPDIDPGTLNQSIRTLGLEGSLYAEVRSDETVLRRVA